MKEIKLDWGEPVVTRQALIETLGNKFGLAPRLLESMGYPPHLGFTHLIEQLKDLARRQTGQRPKHLFVTCGATGAIHAALYALKTQYTDWVVTNKRYFPIYPHIITLSDLLQVDWDRKKTLTDSYHGCSERNFISLVDSLSNPEGTVRPFSEVDIFDAAYASKTYSHGGHVPNGYKVMCGSLSKTLGLAGLRLGWASTNDDNLAKSIEFYVANHNIGLSSVSQGIAEEVLHCLDFDKFETRSSNYLNDNREEVQKILTNFGQGSVPTRGMFAILEIGKIEKRALERAHIKWQPGNSWGENEGWARLSLGQDRDLTRKAVKFVIR